MKKLVFTVLLIAFQTGVASVAPSSNGKWLVSESLDQIVKMWDSATGECLRKVKLSSEWINPIAVSADGKLVAFGMSGNQVQLRGLDESTIEQSPNSERSASEHATQEYIHGDAAVAAVP